MTVACTVVVAAYNVEGYISRALSSLAACLTNEFELICVNDGSTDATPAQIDAALVAFKCPARRLDIEHAGVSCARNAGQRAAAGEYIAFVDGDDMVAPDYAASIIEFTRERKPDIVCAGVYGDSSRFTVAHEDILNISGESAIHRCYDGHEFYIKHTASFYNRAFLERNRIVSAPGCARSQDVEFMLKALICAQSVDIRACRLYIYVKRGSSVTHNYSPGWFDGVDAMLRAADFASARGAGARTVKTLAALVVYAYIMLRARAVRVSGMRPRALRRDETRLYPGQRARVLACARANLSWRHPGRLALLALRAWPWACCTLLKYLRPETPA